jgi:hypothetical protein
MYKVEMFFGAPPGATVYESNEDGDLVPLRFIPNPNPDPEWREFDCHGSVWDRLLKIGEENGWQPMGTLPENPNSEHWGNMGEDKHNYTPIDYLRVKIFLAEDASALADALERFLNKLSSGEAVLNATDKPLLLKDGMTKEGFFAANRDLSPQLFEEFIAFLRKGKFGFAWDD